MDSTLGARGDRTHRALRRGRGRRAARSGRSARGAGRGGIVAVNPPRGSGACLALILRENSWLPFAVCGTSGAVDAAVGEVDVGSETVSELTGHEPQTFFDYVPGHPESHEHCS